MHRSVQRGLILGLFAFIAIGIWLLAPWNDDGGSSASTTLPTASPPPEPTTTTTTAPAVVDTRPETGPDGYPDASSTGPLTDDLRPIDGFVADEEGQVIEGVAIDGQLTIAADDVTIRNARITSDGAYGILVDEVDGAIIEDVEIVGGGTGCSAAIAPFGTWVAHRVDASGCIDGIKMAGGQHLFESYVHDLATGPETHNDAIQITDGTDGTIRGNRLIAPAQNAAIMMSSNFGPVADWVISDNWFEGGTYTVYVRNQGHGDPVDVRIEGNYWVPDSWQYGPIDVDGEGVTLAANDGV